MRASACGLLKSNHGQEAGISQAQKQDAAGGNRRSIPDDAREHFWLAPDRHAIRRIDFPVASTARGSLLFLPGRGDAYEKYLETLAHWQSGGWQVTALDWRGQAGSGRLGRDHVAGHVDDFGTWVGDLAAFWKQWVEENPAPHVLVGHSMGGHLVLRAVAEEAVIPDGLVLSAPMLGFVAKFLPMSWLHGIAWLMTRIGDPARLAWKWSEKPLELPKDRPNLLTHDPERYADEIWWRQRRPEIAMGPGSWGWVERAYASMRALQRPGVLEAVSVPTYVIATSEDRLVDPLAIARAVARIPGAEALLFGSEARHEILREVDAVRDRALAGIDGFLEKLKTGQIRA